jgi:putative addiction module component (TIGR02574 family)
MNRSALLSEIKRLSPEEQLDLIADVWDGLNDADCLPDPTAAQLAEAHRRLEEHRRDAASAVPADDVLARLRTRLG